MDEASASRYRAAEAALWRENGAAPQERWVDVGGHNIGVRVLEVGQGPPILTVHGITTARQPRTRRPGPSCHGLGVCQLAGGV